MKRIFDFTVSLLLIILLSPAFLLIGIIIAIDAGNPVIYKQYRVGKDNKLFYIYKFRTMKNNTRLAATSELTEADECITRSGRILRKTSLDELPQLFNVLIGDMSFVGPRPLIPEEEDIHALRLEHGVYAVRPGLTGLAQVNGRDKVSIEEKVRLDSEYVNNRTIGLDIRIFLKTFINVFKMSDVVEGGHE
jgi:O-antigen biosynthesis protein WbqP